MEWDMMAPFVTLMIVFMAFFGFMVFADSQLENQCKIYLAEHGYSFVRYHRSGLFGGSEECWGKKNGVNSRVY